MKIQMSAHAKEQAIRRQIDINKQMDIVVFSQEDPRYDDGRLLNLTAEAVVVVTNSDRSKAISTYYEIPRRLKTMWVGKGFKAEQELVGRLIRSAYDNDRAGKNWW